MEIIFAADHAGHPLKEQLKQYAIAKGYTVIDVKPELEPADDYPAIIRKGCFEVLEYKTFGIVFGGSGNGEAMAANKVPGIRCALVYSAKIAHEARFHNNANVMSLGARFCTFEEAAEWFDMFMSTPFEGGRHERRLADLEFK